MQHRLKQIYCNKTSIWNLIIVIDDTSDFLSLVMFTSHILIAISSKLINFINKILSTDYSFISTQMKNDWNMRTKNNDIYRKNKEKWNWTKTKNAI